MDMYQNSPVDFISLAPFLFEWKGHCPDYHLALNSIAKESGWSFQTWLPLDSRITELPDNWYKCLYFHPKWRKRSLLAKIAPFLINASGLKKLIKSLAYHIMHKTDPDKETIFLVETFHTFYLYALYYALRMTKRKKINLWIIYRQEKRQLFFEGKFDKKILNRFVKLLDASRLCLYADTDLLCTNLGNFFCRPLHLLPILTQIDMKRTHCITKELAISLWWPGAPRRPKGLHQIQKLLQMKNYTDYTITLKVAPHPSLKPIPDGITIEYVSDSLQREVFQQHFLSSSAILLPYNVFDYRSASSGLFVESILSGIAPFVSSGTWMAHELNKHNLCELIVNFEDPYILSHIINTLSSEKVANKLKDMQKKFERFHNIELFTKLLKQPQTHSPKKASFVV